MYEFYKVRYVSEVQDGKVKYFKESSDPNTGTIARRDEIPEKVFMRLDSDKYSPEVRIMDTKVLVQTLMDMININHIDTVAFYNEFVKAHRQLQGDFANFMARLFELCADETYRTDARNAYVQILGKHIKNM